jgi:hypothetical protein
MNPGKYLFFLLLFLIICIPLPAEEARVDARGGLRMRSGPGLDFDKILTVPHGSRVSVLEYREPVMQISGRKGRWTRITWNGKTGWVFGGFLIAKEEGYPARLPEDFPDHWIRLTEKEGKYVRYRYCMAGIPSINLFRENDNLRMTIFYGQESVEFRVTEIEDIPGGYRFSIESEYTPSLTSMTFRYSGNARHLGTWRQGDGHAGLYVAEKSKGQFPLVHESPCEYP